MNKYEPTSRVKRCPRAVLQLLDATVTLQRVRVARAETNIRRNAGFVEAARLAGLAKVTFAAQSPASGAR